MPEAEKPEVELYDYLLVLFKRKGIILSGTLAVTALALVTSLLLPKRYEASTIILVNVQTEPGIGNKESVVSVALEAVKWFLRSKGLAQEALQKFALSKPPHRMSVGTFLRENLSVRPLRDSNLIRLGVSFSDPKRAAEIANYMAERAVVRNNEFNQQDTLKNRESIRRQRDEAKVHMEKLQSALLRFQKSARLASLKKDLITLLSIKSKAIQQYSNISREISSVKSSIEEYQKGLEGQPKILSLKKSIDETPAFYNIIQERGSLKLKELFAIRLASEEVNKLYQIFKGELVKSRVKFASLTTQKEELERAIKSYDAKLKALEAKIAEFSATREKLNRDYTIAKTAYELFAKRFNEVSLTVGSKASIFQIMDRAIPPDRPSGPRVVFITVSGAAAGLLFFSFVALFAEYMEKARRARGVPE